MCKRRGRERGRTRASMDSVSMAETAADGFRSRRRPRRDRPEMAFTVCTSQAGAATRNVNILKPELKVDFI